MSVLIPTAKHPDPRTTLAMRRNVSSAEDRLAEVTRVTIHGFHPSFLDNEHTAR